MINKPIVESDVDTSAYLKVIPQFKTEADERKFWEDAANDATEYFDASTMQVSKFTNLKPTSKT
jgi:hypothetical protein